MTRVDRRAARRRGARPEGGGARGREAVRSAVHAGADEVDARRARVQSGLLDNGGTQLGTELLDAQFATKMTGLPGGLVDAIARQLERRPGRTPADPPSAWRKRRRTTGAAHPAARRRCFHRSTHEQAARACRSCDRHPGAFHDRPSRARIGLGHARDPPCRRHAVAQPVRHQGRRRTGTGRSPKSRPPNTSTASRARSSPRFRAYATYEESFRDYARLLKTSPRYQDALGQRRRRRSLRRGAAARAATPPTRPTPTS